MNCSLGMPNTCGVKEGRGDQCDFMNRSNKRRKTDCGEKRGDESRVRAAL